MSCFEQFCYFSVFVVVVQIIRSIIPWIYQNFVGPALFGDSIKFREFGQWAVVTGATDGIGKSYCEQLAEKGLNIVLISRTLQKLEKVAEEIEKTYKVQTRIIPVDFIKEEGICKKIEEGLQGLEIGILVNNVGMYYDEPNYFHRIPDCEELYLNFIRCNVTSVVQMTRIILPGMDSRRKGLIINISSISALIPQPMALVYSATKAFVNKFSEDLRTECQHRGITVQSLCPGFVATKLLNFKRSSWLVPDADTFVRSALRTVGIADKTTGCYAHALWHMTLSISNYLLGDVFKKGTIQYMKNLKYKKKSTL